MFRRKYDRETLHRLIEEEPFDRANISFYRYVAIEDPEKLRDELLEEWSEMRVLGRAYLAKEGINAQLSIPEHETENFEASLRGRKAFKGVYPKYALDPRNDAFLKLRVKVRPKIVADGLPEGAVDLSKGPVKLSPEAFHHELEKEDPIVVDVRNHYESEVGHFKGAITPDSDTFREELPRIREALKGKEDHRILLYCTGGIRCEKAGAYLKEHGFQNVAQLEGGVIEYGKTVREKGLPSKFLGKNFVFDQRLGERITEDVLTHCHQCGEPCDRQVNCRNKSCNLLFVQCEDCSELWEGCCTPACRDELQLDGHEGKKSPNRKRDRPRFNKGKGAKNELPCLIREQNASNTG